ncbi:hypothetical protein EYF80_035393 [Liparis tanakae]|uniref:Uncharacterized protein n=1 Tax=Liparis tanakae TaxID=230148 RepID=A0A4Z2GME0_9TELE|nr:hypothetical protein EYF80_035393 [Liparis tanakae]
MRPTGEEERRAVTDGERERETVSVMSLNEKRNRTISPFSFFIGTMSRKHQKATPGTRNRNPNLVLPAKACDSPCQVSSHRVGAVDTCQKWTSAWYSSRPSRAFSICWATCSLVSAPYRKRQLQFFCITSVLVKPVSSQKPSEQ